MRRTLIVSAIGHAAIIAALAVLPAATPMPKPEPDLANAVEIVFAPPPTPPAPAVLEPPPAETPPLPPPPPVAEPPPPPAQAETPPPKPGPKPHPRPTPAVERPPPELPLPLPTQTPSVAPAPQIAAAPRLAPPPPAPTISPDYRAVLSGWLESHKRYPENARQRGEEGRAVLRFRIDRSGRVLDYAVVSSTGYADLDAAIDAMMRGARLPPFPASMTTEEIEVSVTIRFGLSR